MVLHWYSKQKAHRLIHIPHRLLKHYDPTGVVYNLQITTQALMEQKRNKVHTNMRKQNFTAAAKAHCWMTKINYHGQNLVLGDSTSETSM
jgi:uncharacterized protein YcgL (UPF0745 family)